MNEKILQLIFRATDDASPTIARIGESMSALGVDATAAATESSVAMEKVGASAKVASAETTAAMDRAAAGTEAGTAKMNAASESGSKGFNKVALAAAAVAIGIGFAADKTLKAAGDFQSQLTRLVTSAGESNDKLAMVGAGILNIANQTGTGVKELGDAMYIIESGGQHAADGLLVLKAAAQGAKAEGADLKDVADAITSVLQDYHLKASDSALVTSKLVAAVGQGKTTFQDFASSLHSILPLASSAHESLDDISGALASMTVHGMSADQASQDLSDTLKHMVAPTQVQTKELGQLGLSSSQLADMISTKGLTGTLQTLSQTILEHMGPSGRVMLDAFNKSKDAAADVQIMINSMPPALQKLAKEYQSGAISVLDYREAIKDLPANQAALMSQFASLAGRASGFNDLLKTGSPAAQTYQDALRRVTGDATGLSVALMLTGENTDYVNNAVKTVAKATQDASGNVKGWAEIQNNFNQKMAVAKANLQTAGIAIGTALLPAATAAVAKFSEWLGPLSSAIDHHRQLFSVVMIAVGGFSLLVLGILATSKAITMVKDAVGIMASAFQVGSRISLLALDAIAGNAGGTTLMAIKGLQVAAATPMVLTLAIGAALAAIAYVMAKVQETKAAVEGVKKSQQDLDDLNLRIIQEAKNTNDPVKKAKLLKIANMGETPQLDQSTQFWSNFQIPGFAVGGVVRSPTFAQVGENGPEAIIPLNNPMRAQQVMQEAGISAGSSNINLTVNVGTFTGTQAEFDMLATKIYQSLMRTARANGTQLPAIGVRPA